MSRQIATRAAAGAAALLVNGGLFLLFLSATPPAGLANLKGDAHANTAAPARAALVASGTLQYRPGKTDR